MSAVAAALGASSLFASMPVALREDLGLLMRPVAFARGELVFRQGDRGQHLVVLESGELEALLAVSRSAIRSRRGSSLLAVRPQCAR